MIIACFISLVVGGVLGYIFGDKVKDKTIATLKAELAKVKVTL